MAQRNARKSGCGGQRGVGRPSLGQPSLGRTSPNESWPKQKQLCQRQNIPTGGCLAISRGRVQLRGCRQGCSLTTVPGLLSEVAKNKWAKNGRNWVEKRLGQMWAKWIVSITIKLGHFLQFFWAPGSTPYLAQGWTVKIILVPGVPTPGPASNTLPLFKIKANLAPCPLVGMEPAG